jgi:uncharacterized membrane protein YkvA (DUF1232 family)
MEQQEGCAGTLRDILVLGAAALALIYLINPGAGFIELIPDNFPIIGNMDELGAAAILIGAMRYYGIDPLHLFERRERAKLPEAAQRKRLSENSERR